MRISRTVFGLRIAVGGECDMLLLGAVKGAGGVTLDPGGVLLSHQLYTRRVEELLADPSVEYVVAFPAHSGDSLQITREHLKASIERHKANEALAKLPWGVRV